MSRSARLLRLVQVLRRHRHPVRAEALAAELEVSVRSIYRDVQTLRGQGASIQGEAGVGYVLQPGFMLPPLMFTDDEIEAIVLGLRLSAEHGDAALGKASHDACAKLRAVVPRDLRLLFEETGLLAGPSAERPADTIDLAEVRRSMRTQRKARIAYEDRGGRATDRVIWPVALGFFERVRVLVAWCEERADFRSFRTDRIKSFATLPQPFGRARSSLLREWRAREEIAPQVGGA